MKRQPAWKETIFLCATALVGLALRLFQLGKASLWYDEIQQVTAATQPSFAAMLVVIRQHVAAFPLDYLVTSLVSRFSLQEWALRLPSVMWSVMALVVFYLMVRKWVGWQAAGLAALLLATWATSIHYAQETRYYASLCFFALLTAWALLRVLERPSPSGWWIYILCSILGIYFHPYVFFITGLGALYCLMLFLYRPRQAALRTSWKWALSTGIIFAFFWIGYQYFGVYRQYSYGLERYEPVLLAIGRGLGWVGFPYVRNAAVISWRECLIIGFSLTGIVTLLRSRRIKDNLPLYTFLFGSILQVGVILAADWVKGYWFLYRQVIHLAPATFLLAGIGASEAAAWLATRLTWNTNRRTSSAGSLFFVIAALAMCLASLPRLVEYYTWEKANARQVIQSLENLYQAGSPIWVASDEARVLQYYLQQSPKLIAEGAGLQVVQVEQLSGAPDGIQKAAYLITSADLDAGSQAQLEAKGFRVAYWPSTTWLGPNALWRRGP